MVLHNNREAAVLETAAPFLYYAACLAREYIGAGRYTWPKEGNNVLFFIAFFYCIYADRTDRWDKCSRMNGKGASI